MTTSEDFRAKASKALCMSFLLATRDSNDSYLYVPRHEMVQLQEPGRLKPALIDPLDSVGFVSKGDTSLLSHDRQKSYFDTIKSRYAALAGSPDGRKQAESSLPTGFASLSLNAGADSNSAISTTQHSPTDPRAAQSISTATGLSMIIIAMRKLREAIVASSRVDEFAQTVYLFIIRTTIALGHPESYHPALLYLFRCIHPVVPMSKHEESVFVGYIILDTACRQNELATAFRLRRLYEYRNRKIDAVLMALVHKNWTLFWRAKTAGDVYETRLIEWADERMTDCAVRCLGKSYLSVNKAYIERCT
ncbi:MAG: hypothetical protein Q9181_007762, partial [Wetmoreana brouardii]